MTARAWTGSRPGPSRSHGFDSSARLSRGELVRAYAAAAGTRRLAPSVPGVPTSLVGHLAAGLTDVASPTVTSLVDSLRHPRVCTDEAPRDPMPTLAHDPEWVAAAVGRNGR